MVVQFTHLYAIWTNHIEELSFVDLCIGSVPLPLEQAPRSLCWLALVCLGSKGLHLIFRIF